MRDLGDESLSRPFLLPKRLQQVVLLMLFVAALGILIYLFPLDALQRDLIG